MLDTTATTRDLVGKLVIGVAVPGKDKIMMPPYQNIHHTPASQNKQPEPVMRTEQAIPPVLQQTTKLYQPYQPKKESK